MVMDEIDTCIRQSVLDSVQLEKFQETVRKFYTQIHRVIYNI